MVDSSCFFSYASRCRGDSGWHPLSLSDKPEEGMKIIILASASPRRRELLEKIGLKFEVAPSGDEEKIALGPEPLELAKRMSLAKAESVAQKYENAIIIAADTFVVFKNKILGKPHSEVEARKMLQTLSGKTHSVVTGFTIIDTEKHKILSRAIKTRVFFRKLTTEEIDAYVRSGEPLDKAGAYAIQGLGALFVKKIEDDYFNVIGLPLSALTEALKEFGVNIL